MNNATARNHAGKIEVSEPVTLSALLSELSRSDLFRHTKGVVACDIAEDTEGFGNRLGSCKMRMGDEITHYVKVVAGDDPDSANLPLVLDRYPDILSDIRVSIPSILTVYNKIDGTIKYYVHVMRWIKHEGTLATVLLNLWLRGEVDVVKVTMTSFGEFLKKFHQTYPKLQHNDMNPSNVLVCGATFVLVDCAGFDDEVGDDVRTMITCLNTMAEGGLGETFRVVCTESFLLGYSRG